MLELETQNILKTSPYREKRMKQWKLYNGRIMPFLYVGYLGLIGLIRKILVTIIGLFRRITYQESLSA